MPMVTCSNCGRALSVPEGYSRPAALCGACRAVVVLEPAETIASPSPFAPRKPLMRRYLDRVGIRSFVFQVLLAAWSGSLFLLWFGSSAIIANDPATAHDGASLAMGLFCYGGFWFLVAFPLFIAAISTLKSAGE